MSRARPALLRYAWAFFTVALVVLVVVLLDPRIDRSAVVFFIAAVAVTAWFGGLGPALIATVLSVFAVDYVVLPPVYSFDLRGPDDAIDLVAFVLVAVLISSLNRHLLVARRRADVARGATEVEQQRVAAILESISDAFLALDREWRYVYLNTKAVTMTRLPAEELLGKRIWDVYPQLVDTPLYHVAVQAMEERVSGLAEHNITGTGVWLAVHAYPSEHGVSLYFQDISARKRAEQQLQFLAEVSDVLAASLDYQVTLKTVARLAVPTLADWCAVDMVQADGSLERLAVEHQDPTKIELALELQRRYPSSPDHPTGVPYVVRTGASEFYPDIPDELLVAGTRDAEHLRMARALGLRSAMVVPLIARDRTLGAMTFVLAESARRYDAKDLAFAEALAHRAALAVDNARLFEATQDAQRRAEEALQIRDWFLSVVSHDLRTPLAGIKGFTQLMRRRAAYSEQMVDRIEAQANLLERLIGDLVDVAAFQADRLQLRLRPVDLTKLVQDTVDQVQRHSADHRLRVSAPSVALDGTWDPDRLGQVLQNLLTNAVKYSPEGGDVAVRVVDLGDQVQVSVADHGLGIPPTALPRLFDQFYRAHEERGVPGLGLGLAIARSLIEAHGGRIWAESKGSGQGSTFTFTLPYRSRDETITPSSSTVTP